MHKEAAGTRLNDDNDAIQTELHTSHSSHYKQTAPHRHLCQPASASACTDGRA
jgi:hypothetical protein